MQLLQNLDNIPESPRPPRRVGWFAALATSLLFAWCGGDARATVPSTSRPGSAAGPGPTEFLEKMWPSYPEWLAMLGEILAGKQVDPKAGWYVKGVARSRFDRATVRDRFDRDRDGKVERGEFPGSDSDFRRLDRDGDGQLTEFDIGLTVPGEKASRLSDEYSLAAFTTADRNADGIATAIELHQFPLGIGIPPVYDRILNTVSDDIRRKFEVARKAILLLQSDAGDVDRPDRLQDSQVRTKAQPSRNAVAR